MPSVAPWPVVPMRVMAEICGATTNKPTAHHGSDRFARKYPSIFFVPHERRSPSIMTYPMYVTRMTQFSQCMVLRVSRVPPLQQAEDGERANLHGHHAYQR